MLLATIRKYLHKVARFIEKISPLKGELVEIEFIKNEDEITYKYKKVEEERRA